jgi:hypothetical protein
MTKTVTIGKKLIPLEHIALVEPFDPAAAAGINTEKDFRARVVLIDRDSVLTEETSAIFAEVYGFRMLATDNVATNPAVRFSVEKFEPAEGFNPSKPFVTRLLWRDGEGNAQSKLLLSAPEVVLAVAVKGEAESVGVSGGTDSAKEAQPPKRAGRRRTRLNASSMRPAQ